MMFPDDLCSTVSTLSSAFTELEDDAGVVGGEDEEPGEMKYAVPVKTEIEELIPPGAPLTEDDIDDHFLNSFVSNVDGMEDLGGLAGVDVDGNFAGNIGEAETGENAKTARNRRRRDPDEDPDDNDWTTWGQKPRKKPPPGTARRGGRRKQMSRSERSALSQKQKRASMTPEEKEKLREKWKLEARLKRKRQGEEKALNDLVAGDSDGSPRRPYRMAKNKPTIKEEPESEDDDDFRDADFQLDNDNNEYSHRPKKKTARKSTAGRPRGPGKPKGRKKMAEMTEEERAALQEKWKLEARDRRARRKTTVAAIDDMVKIEDGSEDDDEYMDNEDDEDYGGGKKKRGRKRSSGRAPRRSRSGAGGKRKKISEMTEEEKEAIKAKWREEARIKRARQRETMTPNQREEYLKIQREKRREQRALAKVTMTEEEREEENRKARERKKAKRALMTPEQRKEEAQKVTLRRIERLATMTEDEKKMWKMNNYLQNMARLSRMTPEEIEEKKRQRQEYARKRREKMTPEDLERRRLMIKNYRDSMNPERRVKFLEKLREGYKRRLERLKADPEKWEEVKAKWKEDRLARQKKMKDMGKEYARRRAEGIGVGERRRYVRRGDPQETPEQRQERLRESRRRTQRKIKLKKKLAMQKLLDSGMSLDQIQQQIETPEQREKRLIRHRINRAKWNMRKRLESCGAPPEEIAQKLSELQKSYTPTHNFRPYKPRPDSWKPIDPEDLALLQDGIMKDEPKDESATPAASSKPKQPKASTSRQSTGTGRRGRPPKSLLQQHQQQQQQQQQATQPTPSLATSTVIISKDGAVQFHPHNNVPLPYPQPPISPAATSTCSYVSAAETPEPVQYATVQIHQPQHQVHQQFIHQPQHQQQHHQNTHYGNQYHFQQPIYPHQQPQTQPQTYSLQHILDSITFHDPGNPTSVGTTIGGHQITYQNQQQHDASSHHDYASSYDNHSHPPTSPPASPGGDHDYGGGSFSDFNFQPPASIASTTDSARKRGRPRKDEPPRPKKPKGSKAGHRPGPRGPKKSNKTNVIRDMVCDECGNAYNHAYLREHKNQFHNPNYKNQTCQLCGEKFNVARHWYTHYIRNHVNPLKDVHEKPHMCDHCGQAFRQKNNLEKHKYYMHGDGLKKENFKRCPVCPDEKLFKETVSLYAHLRRKHPGYNRGGHDCYRCDKSFPDEKDLSSHVKDEHPDSYFPCQYCNACRFTRYGLNFHYFRCTKISKETRDEMRKRDGIFSLDRVPLPCEFCGRNVAVFSLTRHYWEMHNVKEENFTCPDCGKGFRVREFWAVHMEEKHLRPLEEMKDLVRSLNVTSKEGLVIKNPDGVKGGVPGNTPSKAATQKRIELGTGKKGGPSKGQKKRKGKRKRRIMVTAEEEGDEDDDDDSSSGEEDDARKKSFRKRRILVMAEEEEGMEGDLEDYGKKWVRTPWKKPGPKSKTKSRRRKADSSEEEEEEEWRASEDDEEEDNGTEEQSAGRGDDESQDYLPESQEHGDGAEIPFYGGENPLGGEEEVIDENELLEAVVKQEILSSGEDEDEENNPDTETEAQ